jgi:hypothetical protein
VSFGPPVTSVGAFAFSGTVIAAISLHNTVLAIVEYAFYRCCRLAAVGCANATGAVAFPPSLTSLGAFAFYNSSLQATELVLGPKLRAVGADALSLAPRLRRIVAEGDCAIWRQTLPTLQPICSDHAVECAWFSVVPSAQYLVPAAQALSGASEQIACSP